MEEHLWRPQAREEALVVQELGDEYLVYDREADVAHCLSPVAAQIWAACDGQHDVAGLARLADASEELVGEALAELRNKNLLTDEDRQPAPEIGVSRRHAVRRIAAAGAAMTAAPLVISAALQPASAFASGGTVGRNGVCGQI